MSRLKRLGEHGQSVWLDYIQRSLVTGGGLARLIEEDGVSGMTSNPTIFEKAIAGSADYDEAIAAMLAEDREAGAQAIYDRLAVEDIRMAADALRPVFDASGGADGFVSLEVSPHLAGDTARTVDDARRLWAVVSRPNLMIKVPATPAGIPAIEALIREGINVNVTLVFSLAHYEAAALAYIRGLERCEEPGRVASVASFFVSRVDTSVDRLLEEIGTPEALALRGAAAVANARLAYARFEGIFRGEEFTGLSRQGARVQRPLWASTGTKNPAYSDVLYVEELVGPETVNTLPPATMDAFRDHGEARGNTIRKDPDGARVVLERIGRLGIDLDAVTAALQEEGVAAFAGSHDSLLAALEEKRRVVTAARSGGISLALGEHGTRLEERLGTWEREGLPRRLWAKDRTLWFAEPRPEIEDRLGWLDLPHTMADHLAELTAFAGQVAEEGVRHVVLLGMGGSSLAPEVFSRTFGSAPGYPDLVVLDSTHPTAVLDTVARVRPDRTLFLVSSKSGTTAETLSLFRFFWGWASHRSGTAGRQFAAITDPQTPLEELARERGFRRVFTAPPDVGGRYSALTAFGLLPAALCGVDIQGLLGRAQRAARATGALAETQAADRTDAPSTPTREDPALVLGAALAELATAGRDKVTFLASRSLEALPSWIEQLIAESTGKDGQGIVPVVDEPTVPPERYGADRVFVALTYSQDPTGEIERRAGDLAALGHPVIRIRLADREDLGGEFFRWEVAVAVAGSALGIHPFDQPDVQLAKELAQKAMSEAGRRGRSSAGEEGTTGSPSRPGELAQLLGAWMDSITPGDYVGLQAYLAPSEESWGILQEMRRALLARFGVATTLGYGPRFLHSTGQLHKGGPGTGVFLQLVDDQAEDVAVPESRFTFGELIAAQSLGDLRALRQRGRRVLRIDLGREVAEGLERVAELIGR